MVVLINSAQMLRRGLRSVKISDSTQKRRNKATNIRQFKSIFGKHPLHLCRLWRDLQTIAPANVRVTDNVASAPNSLLGFFIANNFLRCYERSDDVRAALFRGMDTALLNCLTWV